MAAGMGGKGSLALETGLCLNRNIRVKLLGIPIRAEGACLSQLKYSSKDSGECSTTLLAPQGYNRMKDTFKV